VKNLLLLFPVLLAFSLSGQNDSTLLLAPERLQGKDIVIRDPGLRPTMAISATHSLEEVDQLPWSVWVVTADDILRYGLVTLGDVLKAAPGIRVSASGNALEGETFLMRGLSGNQYVKILINDVPIKASVAAGISIGAQLPIRQAERIEILYGPASTLYGGDACVGVINIILKESERPVFTTADISFGGDGYTSLDVMCGGKLGKDKKIFRFSVYGSSTLRERANIYFDQNIFNADNYLRAGENPTLYRQNPNFISTDTPGGSFPKTVPVGHESRLFGINLNWRSLRFTYQRMGRTEYSSLGLNPLAVSWSNPGDRLVERNEVYSLAFQHTRRRWVSYTNFSVLNYRINNTSTSTYIFDRLSAADFQFERQLPQAPADSVILQRVFAKLAQNSRYTVAGGFDARAETRFKATLRRRLSLDAGFQFNLGTGVAPTTHLPVPVEVDLLGQAGGNQPPFSPLENAGFSTSVFGQLEYRASKWSVSVGSASNLSLNYNKALINSPRAAAFYQVDSSWSVYANYATGFRRPSFYEIAQSYQLVVSDAATGESKILPGEGASKTTETTRTFEGGLRFHQKGTRISLSYFQQQAYNLIRNGVLQKVSTEVFNYGYATTPGLGLSMWGLQGIFRSESYDITSSVGVKNYRLSGRAELLIQYAKGKEWYGPQRTPTDDVFNAPRWQTQVRLLFSFNKLEFMISSNRQTSTLSKSVVYSADYQRQPAVYHPKFRTWDMRAQTHLSNHFLVYILLKNAFNQHYAGLDATGTSDDLLFNPQPGRMLRFGVNYNMN